MRWKAPNRVALLTTLFLVILSTSVCLGQTSLRTLSGIVTDRQKEPLKGAVVQVQNEITNSVVSYITLADGTFSFKRLNAGNDYWVSARYHGKRSRRRELSRFNGSNQPSMTLVVSLH